MACSGSEENKGVRLVTSDVAEVTTCRSFVMGWLVVVRAGAGVEVGVFEVSKKPTKE